MKKLFAIILSGPIILGAVLGAIIGLLTTKTWFNFYIITSIFPNFIRVPLSNFYPETLLPLLIGAIIGAFIGFGFSIGGTIIAFSKGRGVRR